MSIFSIVWLSFRPCIIESCEKDLFPMILTFRKGMNLVSGMPYRFLWTMLWRTVDQAGELIRIQADDGKQHHYLLQETPGRMEELFAKGENFFVAIENDQLVGFASVEFATPKRAKLHFVTLSYR